MAECSKCGKKTMSFTCRYCGKKFCSEHRLPENHDCTGLESGKKDQFKSSDDKKEKWFQDKFSDKKDSGVKKETKKEFERPTFLNESKRILKSNIAFIIIGVTGLSFMLHEAFPAIKSFLSMSPALTQAAVEATNQAANQVQPGIGTILDKTIFDAPWTIFTIMIVHAGLFHFLANMITFYFFGTAVEKAMGGIKMLKIYLFAGLASSLGYILFRNFLYYTFGPINGTISLAPAVGASGAVIAMFALTAMLYPEAEVLLYFVVPMKIKTALHLFAGIELISLATKIIGLNVPILGGLAASAHLTGLAVGYIIGKKVQDKYGRRTSVFDPMSY